MNAKQYLICLRCNREDFVIKPDAIFEQVFKGETLKVESPGMICQHCGYVALGAGQLDELRKRTADAYRKQHGLLTSAQIKAMRRPLAMTQRQFADFLRVGEASVKRWETWLVQDASSDELMRVKCIMSGLTWPWAKSNGPSKSSPPSPISTRSPSSINGLKRLTGRRAKRSLLLRPSGWH